MIVSSTIYIILTIIIALLVGAFLYLVVYPWVLSKYHVFVVRRTIKATAKLLRKMSKDKPKEVREELEKVALECDRILKEEEY